MVLLSTDRSRASASMHALLWLAGQRDMHMTRTKAAKLLYLADLRSIKLEGAARSGVLWRWWHYGPYCQTLRTAEDSLVEAGLVTRESWRLSASVVEHRLAAAADSVAALVAGADDFIAHLDAVLDEHGHSSAQAITDVAYRTEPMLDAQAEGVRGMLLDLGEPPSTTGLDGIRAELAERFSHVPAQDTADSAPEGCPDAEEIVGVLRGNRAYANSILLG